jgi:hypothetical protein
MAGMMTFNVWSPPKQDWRVPESNASVNMKVGSWKSGALTINRCWNSAELENPAYPARDWQIEQSDLPEDEPYNIIRDFPIKITKNTEVEFTATFEDANLSIGGISYRDAFQALIYEILDAFDYYSEHQAELGPEPQRQLAVLNQHIVKVDR